jgi:hypothetical protein
MVFGIFFSTYPMMCDENLLLAASHHCLPMVNTAKFLKLLAIAVAPKYPISFQPKSVYCLLMCKE